MTLIDITDEESLGALIDSNDTVFIDFWAPWCRPCIGFHPILKKVAGNHPELTFCRVDVTQVERLKAHFEIESIPTLVAIRDHVLVASQPGMLSEEALESIVNQVANLDMDEVRAAADS